MAPPRTVAGGAGKGAGKTVVHIAPVRPPLAYLVRLTCFVLLSERPSARCRISLCVQRSRTLSRQATPTHRLQSGTRVRTAARSSRHDQACHRPSPRSAPGLAGPRVTTLGVRRCSSPVIAVARRDGALGVQTARLVLPRRAIPVHQARPRRAVRRDARATKEPPDVGPPATVSYGPVGLTAAVLRQSQFASLLGLLGP